MISLLKLMFIVALAFGIIGIFCVNKNPKLSDRYFWIFDIIMLAIFLIIIIWLFI